MNQPALVRMRRGLAAIAIGKPLSALAGLLTLVLLSGLLPTAQYAGYVAAWACAEILMLASNLGLMHAAYRYVRSRVAVDPNLPGRVQVIGPVWWLVALRALTLLTGGALLVLLLHASAAPWVSGVPVPLFLVLTAAMAFAEGLARYVEILFESLQLQWRAQLGTIFRTLAKLAALMTMAWSGTLALGPVLLVEVGVGILGLLLGLAMLVRSAGWPAREAATDEHGQPLALRRVLRYVWPAYLTQLLGLAYGPDLLKVALASVSGPQALAVFGFAFSLASVLGRYLPVQLLAGLLRPAFVLAGGAGDGAGPQSLARLVSVTIKLNWIVLGAALVLTAPWAGELTGWLSRGRYPDAGLALWCLLLGLSGVALHATLGLVCLARENSTAPLLATLAAALVGLPLTLALASRWGAVGMALGWGLAEGVWVLGCALALKLRAAEPIQMAWADLARLPLAALVLVLASLGLMSLGWMSPGLAAGGPSAGVVVGVLATLVFLGYAWRCPVFSAAEQAGFRSLLPRRLHFLFRRGAS